MRDVLLIAAFALAGAVCAGLGGAVVLRLVRHRSVAVSLTVVAAVTVTAMLAGTLAVARAMFLSAHDLWVVTVVGAMAALVSLGTALVLGRWVVARSRALARAARDFGDGGSFSAPDGAVTAELAALTRELAATSAKLDASRGRERALETSRRELVAWISHDLRTPSPVCGRWPRRWRTAWPPTPPATTGRSVPRSNGSPPWSPTSSSSPASTRDRSASGRAGSPPTTWSATR